MSNVTFTQTTSSATWTVTHNLNCHPVCDVMVNDSGSLKKILPQAVVYVDANVIEVRFSVPRTGVVRLIGPYSGFTLNGAGSIDPT